MDIFEALYTTRAMRRVRPEPVPIDVQRQIIDAAIRAPSGGNTQGWRFLLVDDRDVVAQLAPLYKDAVDKLWSGPYAQRAQAAELDPTAPESVSMRQMMSSVQWMADNFDQIPLLMFGFVRFDPSGGSIWPAVWSAQLAARAHGVGSAPTSILSAFHAAATFEILGVPTNEHWTMAAMVSFGYPTGVWATAPRRPAHEVAFRNHWGAPVGFTVDEPLWSPLLSQ